MSKSMTICLLVGYCAVTLVSFGFLAYASDDAMLCMASLINNANSPCPRTDPVDFAGFHIGAAHKISIFSLTDIVLANASLLLLLFVLISGSGLISFRFFSGILSGPEMLNYEYRATSWLALHEKVDPHPAV